MMTNVGVIDAALRLIAGLLLIAWSSEPFESAGGDLFGWAVFLIGIALVATALLRHCPVYARLGTTSCAPYTNEERL